MSCDVRCGNGAATRDGTANSQARTDRSHPANTRSSSRSLSVGSVDTALVARLVLYLPVQPYAAW